MSCVSGKDLCVVNTRQLERLITELEKVEAFHKLMTNDDGSLCCVITAEEDDLLRAHEQFSQALRELKYLVEDIGVQVLFEG